MNARNKAYKDLPEEQKIKARKRALESYYSDLEKAALKAKNWRDKNKESLLIKQREFKRNRKLWAIQYLGGVCQSCGQQYHPAVYEFHHIQPETKDRDPSKMMSLSLAKLTAELDKCKLLCANCHRLEHHGDKY